VMAKGKEPKCDIFGNEASFHSEADYANMCYKCDVNVYGFYWRQGMLGWFYAADAINTLK